MASSQSERPLDEAERASLSEALGVPTRERIMAAIDEVERQVAMEDLVLLMIDAATETARAFFDILVEVAPVRAESQPGLKENSDE